MYWSKDATLVSKATEFLVCDCLQRDLGSLNMGQNGLKPILNTTPKPEAINNGQISNHEVEELKVSMCFS